MPDGPAPRADEDTTEDALLDGRVRLLQPRRGHRAGTDAVLLAAALAPRAGDVVVDLGAATGAVGLMMAARSPLAFDLVCVERDPWLVDLCEANIRRNGLAGRARAARADILEAGALGRAGIRPESADVVVSNPPFLEQGTGRSSPDAGRASARELAPGGLERWIAAGAEILKPKGRLALIHRADGLADCLGALAGRFGQIGVRSIHPRTSEPATRIVITATKGSRGRLTILAPLILHDPVGGFTAEAAALHGGSQPR